MWNTLSAAVLRFNIFNYWLTATAESRFGIEQLRTMQELPSQELWQTTGIDPAFTTSTPMPTVTPTCDDNISSPIHEPSAGVRSSPSLQHRQMTHDVAGISKSCPAVVVTDGDEGDCPTPNTQITNYSFYSSRNLSGTPCTDRFTSSPINTRCNEGGRFPRSPLRSYSEYPRLRSHTPPTPSLPEDKSDVDEGMDVDDSILQPSPVHSSSPLKRKLEEGPAFEYLPDEEDDEDEDEDYQPPTKRRKPTKSSAFKRAPVRAVRAKSSPNIASTSTSLATSPARRRKSTKHSVPTAAGANGGEPIWPRPCGVDGCEQTVRAKGDWTTHLLSKVHTPIPQFFCPACDKSFTRRDARKRHIKATANCQRAMGEELYQHYVPISSSEVQSLTSPFHPGTNRYDEQSKCEEGSS